MVPRRPGGPPCHRALAVEAGASAPFSKPKPGRCGVGLGFGVGSAGFAQIKMLRAGSNHGSTNALSYASNGSG